MNIPELPVELALPTIQRAVALTVVLAAFLGGVAAHVVTTLRPFARHRTSPVGALLGLSALVAGCIAFGTIVVREQAVLLAAAVASGIGASGYSLVYTGLGRRADAGASDVLSDAELRRAKTRADRWVLVTGPPGSGKTALVTQMMGAAPDRLMGPVRNARDGALRVTQVAVQDPVGGVGQLRVWEAPTLGARSRRLPSLEEFDAAVLTIDPVQHAPIADSFPDMLQGGSPVDANGAVLQLADSMREGCVVWAVATKSDLLRFSVHPGLLDLPLQPGPGWHQQVRGMDVRARRELAETLELGQLTRDHQSAFRWGTGSPLFTYVGGSNGQGAFGSSELMRTVLDTLWPGWGR